MYGLLVVLIVAAVLIGAGIWVLSAVHGLVGIILGIILIAFGVLFLASRLFGGHRGTRTPIV